MNTPEASRVLILGGMGFIGQHLTQACRSAGMIVRVADMFLPAPEARQDGVEYVDGDYKDSEFLQSILEEVDSVVHLVHDTMILNQECNMDVEFERNVRPAMHLMDMCCVKKIKKFLFVSSGGTVYGDQLNRQPIVENSSTKPISLYGTSKLIIENIGFLYNIQKNLPFIVARPGNAYGPGQKPFRGQGFVATAFASALKGEVLNIFGDGSVVRDYIHARDLADALVAILRFGKLGEAYNIGTSNGVALHTLLNEYITPILEDDGYTLQCQYTPPRGVDVSYNVLSNDKLRRDTNFSPIIELSDGLRETLMWLKNFNLM
ncbi:NAD-dependent epimerase/dehydratase family protein [Hahella aquimaris]|uniref:NAD-dependent epimerase/dehydratase family protein n=1 Tax=Hahella sp. HNIBRBA332 TaxID=3015983 RepID=UPI00273CE8AE|nr:NAD-dependent epimerase/dehydratase family protein [Hahella sp. HNIBRBA332]WLQ17383.1 NAD-dependent epimerase/dehydratase family protein [Hahella sp. HNIBRBA332]